MKACIVTGTRYGTPDVWRQMIQEAIEEYGLVIHGGAQGVDSIAGDVCREIDMDCLVMRADWDKHGKAAGPIRNQAMLTELLRWRDENDSEIAVLAFHGDIARSKGTGDMVRRARTAGVKVRVFA